MAPTVEEIVQARRSSGPATILAIGTANPPNCYYQADYPDYYFGITNTNQNTELKDKFQRICDKSMIEKRYLYLTKEILEENPSLLSHTDSSLDCRQEMVISEVPRLGKEAALRAIKEWGQPKSLITHLIMCTATGIDMPGADYQIMKLLGLHHSVKRFMLYQLGCFAGVTTIRLAKDLAENNKGARILVVCSEITAMCFSDPESDLHSIVGQAIFADGAGALIIGADPDLSTERPIFEMVCANQTTLPDTLSLMHGHVKEVGLTFHLDKQVPGKVSDNIEKALVDVFTPLGIHDWNELFWIVHPGGPAILNQVEEKIKLKPDKLMASRKVLREYGNMWSPTVFFILDQMRKKSEVEGNITTGEGLDWGVLFGFGPGVTVETVVLHSVPIQN